jgi:UPF0042 nucleotide-binding protein
MKKPKRDRKSTADSRRRVLLVTGLSGAGLSTALKSLEDLGYKAVDNLPLSLVGDLLAQKEGLSQSVAIGIDSRTWDFSAAGMIRCYDDLRRRADVRVELIFIDCQDSILQQRFTETRRVHPLAVDRPVSDGVALDRKGMAVVRKSADHVIDTTDLKPRDLKRVIAGHFKLQDDHGLLVHVMSFGFKQGLPRESDLVFDVRFLDNPYWHKDLRALSGLDKKVAAHIARDPAFDLFIAKVTDLLGLLLPRYDHEGKSYLTLALGCTGGRHRSVFAAERIFNWLDRQGYSVSLRHRDIDLVTAPATEGRKSIKRKGKQP